MVHIVIGLQIVGIVIILIALRLLISGDGSRSHVLMGYFLCGSLVHNIGYLLELTAPTLEVAITAIRIENLGSTFVPLCYCCFIYEYCYEKVPRKLLRLLAVLDFLILPILFWFDRHTLVYRQIGWMETPYGHHYLNLEYGPLYIPIMAIRIFMPYVLTIYALVHTAFIRSSHREKKQCMTFLLISVLPVIALVVYVAKLTYVYDLSALVLGLALSMVVILVWSRRNYDFHRLAADVVLDGISDGVVALDARKRLVSYNQAAAEIFVELKGRGSGESIEDVKELSEELLEDSAPQQFALRGRYYESHARRIMDINGILQGYALLVLDMTDTHNYIDQIAQMRKQAEEANVAKSAFLANMSHEIRTPMNAIVGLSEIIMEESRGMEIYSNARDVRSAARNLLDLINDILDLSKVEAGKMELILADYDIRTVVGEVVSMMDMAASKKGILLQCIYDETIPCRYNGDQGRIKQILINLLNNAVKFTQKGYVKITVGGKAGPAEHQEQLVFTIEDTGCGIRKEDQQRIFDNFTQVDARRNRSVEGTGLGLSITKHIVALMDGSIEMESVYNEGTTFTVTIPQTVVNEQSIGEVPESVSGEREAELFVTEGYRVLIVDDNLVNRKVAQGFLKSYCFELTEAASGPEAIELVKNNRYDIIFMDHMMPEMDGIEAVDIIRRDCGENGTAPVIIALTANAMAGVREKFLSSGFQDFITKPLDRHMLNEVLVRWIPSERRLKPQGEQERREIDPESVHIKGIDLDAAMRYHSGSAMDYRELLELYCIEGKRKRELLQEHFRSRDYERYGIEVHGLKSASANIGALRLSEMARDHEEAAAKGDETYLVEEFPRLLDAYEKQMDNIREFLNRQQENGVSDLGGIDSRDLLQRIKEALGLLEDFHSRECAQKIEELCRHRLDAEIQSRLQEIQEQLKLYEDDAAEELLHRLISYLDDIEQEG
ncbi:MAG: ATP-binding protein [bacterium]|nr:ATP-binding protein [bacterium]MCM1376763.1 ATP-binding protein [Muribaculum sp.]